MILKNEEKINESNLSSIIVECTCGTHSYKISTYDDDNIYFLELWASNFYTKQPDGFFKKRWNKLKNILCIIRNKNWRLDDIVLEDKDIVNLIKALEEIRDKKNIGGE